MNDVKEWLKMGYKYADKHIDEFYAAGLYIVDNECTDCDGLPIVGEARETLAFMKAYDMATGAGIVKDGYLILGVWIGVAVCYGGLKLKEYIDNKIKENNEL